MKTEEKQLLTRVLTAMLSYGLYVQVGNEICSLREFDCEELTCGVKHSDGHFSGRNIDEIKPYLRSMSSMTEEEKDTYDRLVMCNAEWVVVEYLLKNHFDFLGLIEKWLAIEAPEGMYN